jgi:histidyl-tRNA synthetase
MKKIIVPTLGSGFRDYLPKDMIPRQKMLDIIRDVFESFGFVPVDTPGIEREEVLLGGDSDSNMQVFRVGHQRDEGKFALRFDLTIPLARIVSMYRDLEWPFKRYQVGKVWRGERPQAGRFREFTQFDADIVGSSSLIADAEIIALVYETMTALGFSKFTIKVNNRKILNGLAKYVGFNIKETTQVLRSMDKLDKVGWGEVARELQEKSDLKKEQLERLRQFTKLRGANHDATLNEVGLLMADSEIAKEGINEVKKIRQYLTALGVPDDKWTIDFSVARGLGYYTGPVFETILNDIPSIGSVFSGGRYDDLVSKFSDQSVPATGASIGVDRLFAAMEKLNLIKPIVSTAQVIVLNFDSTAEETCITMASNLRKYGISTEIYLGKESGLKEQLGYALRQEIPIVVIIGENEKGHNVAQIKHLASRKQLEVPLSEVPEKISQLLS